MASSTRIPVKPLEVEIDGVGKYAQVSTVQDMIGFLTSLEWPDKKPPAFHRALMSSFDALDLVIDPTVARANFVNAAHAAGMHVLPDDMAEIRQAG
jgi:hypothetical protein